MFSSILTSLMKQTISDLGLYNTGNLYNSISVSYVIQNNTLLIDVSAVDYIVYLKDEYSMSNRFSLQSGFEQEVERIFTDVILSNINESLTTGREFRFNPEIFVRYNGK